MRNFSKQPKNITKTPKNKWFLSLRNLPDVQQHPVGGRCQRPGQGGLLYNISRWRKRGSVFLYLQYHNTYLGVCLSDYDCLTMDPTKPKCMRSTGMCYECMTSADCTPPNTCDPPPDGDGTCGFELGLLIISKDRWRKRDHTPSSL